MKHYFIQCRYKVDKETIASQERWRRRAAAEPAGILRTQFLGGTAGLGVRFSHAYGGSGCQCRYSKSRPRPGLSSGVTSRNIALACRREINITCHRILLFSCQFPTKLSRPAPHGPGPWGLKRQGAAGPRLRPDAARPGLGRLHRPPLTKVTGSAIPLSAVSTCASVATRCRAQQMSCRSSSRTESESCQ